MASLMTGRKLLRGSKVDILFDILNIAILTLLLLCVLYPLYFVMIASISSPEGIYLNKVWFLPYDVSFDGYSRIFRDENIWNSYANSIFYTICGTLVNLAATLPAAYALSRKDMVGRNFFMGIFLVTMFFSGGLIPTYLLVTGLHLTNTRLVLLIINAVSVYNLIIARTFFVTTIPDELLDASRIDGCNNVQFFAKIVLPLSLPITVVMSLFYGEMHWNSFFDALLYVRKFELYPLQIILRNILTLNQSSMLASVDDVESIIMQQKIVEQIKYGLFLVSSVPLILLYLPLQRYFEKGVMIGALKG